MHRAWTSQEWSVERRTLVGVGTHHDTWASAFRLVDLRAEVVTVRIETAPPTGPTLTVVLYAQA